MSSRPYKPSRWRRRAARRGATVRRQLGIGALVGLVVGLVAQLFVNGNTPSEIVPLVRIALLFPAVIFGVWWLLSPELKHADEVLEVAPDETGVDVDARLRRIEETFDATAVPAARRHGLDGPSGNERDRFRASIVRPAVSDDPAHEFGVPRPASGVHAAIRRRTNGE